MDVTKLTSSKSLSSIHWH